MNKTLFASEQQVTKKNAMYDLSEMQRRKQESLMTGTLFVQLFPEVNGIAGYHIYQYQPVYQYVNRRPHAETQQPYVFSSFANLHAPTSWVTAWMRAHGIANFEPSNLSEEDFAAMTQDYIDEYYMLVGISCKESFVSDLTFNSVSQNPVLYIGGVVNTYNTGTSEIMIGDTLVARPPTGRKRWLDGGGIPIDKRIAGIPHTMPCGVVTKVVHEDNARFDTTYDLIVEAMRYPVRHPNDPLFAGLRDDNIPDNQARAARKAIQLIKKRDKWILGKAWKNSAVGDSVEIQLMQIML